MRRTRRPVVIPTTFADSVLGADLQVLPDSARTALTRLRKDAQKRGGIPSHHLKRCQIAARDGTSLPGCVKTYVPWPTGQWGLVLRAAEDPYRPFALHTIAYGRRHPTARHVSVYQLAHRRLNCQAKKQSRQAENG